MLNILLTALPFLSVISIAVTVIAWVAGRRGNSRQMTEESFTLKLNRAAVRQNGLLLIVDAAVAIYFAVITPNVAGFFWVILVVVVSAVYNIYAAIAGIYEKWVVDGDIFTHSRFLHPQINFRFDEIVYADVTSQGLTLFSTYEKLTTIRHKDIDNEGLFLLAERLEEVGIPVYDDIFYSGKKTITPMNVLLPVAHAGISVSLVVLTIMFIASDLYFLYNAINPIDVIEGYRNWFYTRIDNVASGMTIIFVFNLASVLFLRVVNRFTNVFIFQFALSFVFVIVMFFAELDESSWALERLNQDLAAIAYEETTTQILVFGLDWEHGGDFILHPGEFAALEWWGLRALNQEGVHLLFARTMPSPAEIRYKMQGEEFQIHQIDPLLRFIKVTHTPRLGVVLEWKPINNPALLSGNILQTP
jgi:hypothetical protein